MESIKVEPLASQVSFRIREMIRCRFLTKGQKIKELELCEKLGVSRTPVREALRILKSEGLIDIIPNKGSFVSEPSIGKIKEMFEVMTLLEGETARLAAARMSPEELKKIESLHAELEFNYAQKDSDRYLKVNTEYHMYIQKVAKNELLSDLIGSIRNKILLYRTQQLYQKGRFEESIREHRELLAAFKQGDEQNAEKAMKKHLKKQGEVLVELHFSKDAGSA